MSAVSRRIVRRLSSAIALAGVLSALMASSASAALTLDVVGFESDANDIQAVYVEGTTGQFRLNFGSGGPGVSETVNIAAGATAQEVEAALNALSNVSDGGGSVSVRKNLAEGDGNRPFLVTFDGGPLGMKLQPLMTAKQGTTPLAESPLGGGPAMAYVATRLPGGLSHSDERVDYTVKIKNTSPVASEAVVGDVLACLGNEIPGTNPAAPKSWTPNGFEPTQYDYEWRRNGAVIAGETDDAYTVTAADAGAALQCMVKGTNANASTKWASLPGRIVSPAPTPLPPIPVSSTLVASRPTVTGTGVALRTCNNPTNWTAGGTPVTFTHQWLRNGDEIPGATSNTYLPDAGTGGADVNKVLQCMVTGKTGTGTAPEGGGLVATSAVSVVGTVPSPPVMNPVTPATTPEALVNVAAGLTAEFELPSDQSFVQSAQGKNSEGKVDSVWNCTTVPPSGGEPPKAQCVRVAALPAQAETSLTLGIGLGSDLADSASVAAGVSAPGVGAPITVSSSFGVEPARGFGIIPGRFSARALDAQGEDFTQAGGHPPLAVSNLPFAQNHRLVTGGSAFTSDKTAPVEPVRNIMGDVPPGFIGNPRAVPDLCPSTDAILSVNCPPGSAVGELAIQSTGLGTQDGATFKRMALFAIKPETGVPAQFAAVETFNGGVYVVTPRLRPEDGYAISIDAIGIAENPLPLLGARVTLCSYGSNLQSSGTLFLSCKRKGDPEAYAKPFLTTQTECAVANPVTTVNLDSWAKPGVEVSASALSPKMTGCAAAPFEPKLDLQPTSKAAESASGLDVELTVPTEGLEKSDDCYEKQGDATSPVVLGPCLTQAHLKKTTVTLPKGMSLNPSAADGLAACTQAQLGMANGVPNNDPVNCPDASKIGTAVVKTPILEETLEGGVYLAKQGDHPFPGDIAAIYVVAESKERGVLIKLPGRVEIRPGGQIVSTFDDNPQAPFSSLELNFNSGPRAALMTPQRCGSYEIVSQLTPWSAADPDNPTPAETVTQTSKFDVTSGPGGGACPTGAMAPKLNAGITNTIAGESSPFVLSLSRGEGTQRFNGLTMSLPPGLSANLSGVPYCSDATLASIPTALGTGQAEINRPSCPAASRVGSVAVGAGAGNPYYVNTGSAYLAGPYKGAPLSLAVVIPAVAGPFDLGNVVVRNAAYVDPRTAQVSIKSDPLPTQVHNLPVDVRDVRVTIDRPGFMRAPTNCEEMRIDAVVSGEEGGSAPLSNRFRVGECGSLDFGPKLKLEYRGQTKRTGNPALRAVLTQPAGQANIANTQVILPKGSFIDNAHINNPCTRAQYAANACPAGSILGKATAWSPLLDEPLSGNVYFRSNGGERELPDIVAKLQGQVEVELVGYVDSVVNKKTGSSRVRNTFAIVPDAPVSRFVLNMKGGKLGLIENSKNLCKQKNRATVKMGAHNGRALTTEPVVKTSCGKKKKAKKRKR